MQSCGPMAVCTLCSDHTLDRSSGILDGKITYLCGNSLGLSSKRSIALVQEELNAWSTRCVFGSIQGYLSPEHEVDSFFASAVVGHFSHPYGRPWTEFCDELTPILAELVGKWASVA